MSSSIVDSLFFAQFLDLLFGFSYHKTIIGMEVILLLEAEHGLIGEFAVETSPLFLFGADCVSPTVVM